MAPAPLRLSVLDLFPVASNRRPTDAIRDSLTLARRVDQLGYHRYWIAEHHNMAGIASSAPEVLITHVAGLTRRIRVGSGGIMVPNHAPLRVVEIFRTLEALFPGRIDLGLGRAPGTDPLTSSALRRGSDDVDAALAELFAFARGRFPAGNPYAEIVAMPSDAPMPPIWMLGSTQAGARIAARNGLAFAFAGHFAMAEAAAAMARYRTDSSAAASPYAILALSVVCADTEERAEALAAPLRLAYARIARGVRGPFPTVEEAAAHRFTPAERMGSERMGAGLVVGTPERVKAAIEAHATRLAADEIMVSTIMGDVTERIASYERLARVFGLAAEER